MNKHLLVGLSFALLLASVGCSKARIVGNPGTSYESLGFLQEKIPVRGMLLNRSYPSLTKKLNKKIAKMARNKYGADAVSNIHYWPSPDSDALVDYLYARGEMIRYKPFEESAQVLATDTVN